MRLSRWEGDAIQASTTSLLYEKSRARFSPAYVYRYPSPWIKSHGVAPSGALWAQYPFSNMSFAFFSAARESVGLRVSVERLCSSRCLLVKLVSWSIEILDRKSTRLN